MKKLQENFRMLMSEFGNPRRLTTSDERLKLYACLAETIKAISVLSSKKSETAKPDMQGRLV